jgi:hypothetical protein
LTSNRNECKHKAAIKVMTNEENRIPPFLKALGMNRIPLAINLRLDDNKEEEDGRIIALLGRNLEYARAWCANHCGRATYVLKKHAHGF